MTSTQDYADSQAASLPPGPALGAATEEGANLRAYLEGSAASFALIRDRATALLEEADPRTALEALPDWERIYGLPDPCIGEVFSLAARRAQVLGKDAIGPGQSKQFFLDLAAELGFSIEIEDGIVWRGEGGTCEQPINEEDFVFVWIVHAPTATPFFAAAGTAAAGDAIVETKPELLECIFQRLKPAHTVVSFVYDLTYTGYAPWSEIPLSPLELVLEPRNLAVDPDAGP